MRPSLRLVFSFYLVFTSAASADSIGEVSGIWRTVRHGALVNIVDCGNSTPCGVLVWASGAVFNGNTQDTRNRRPSLRERPLLGVPILWGFQPSSSGWQNGRVYNPEDGKTFRANLQLLSNNELRVTGCLGPLCRSQIWTRSSPP